MKMIKIITSQLVRMYSTRRGSAGVRNKVKFLTKDEDSKIKLEDFDMDDLEMYEGDFMNASEAIAMHDSKIEKQKKLLPYHIVKSKYFKEIEPSFLTYTEKVQIKKLHNDDPEEWTIHKLSQSFPALPRNIKKVLKSNTQPKSVDIIIKYDNKVIENWKKFKCNKLALNPDLKEHLMKFKNRIISLPDRESLKRFIPCDPVLPEPKSNVFSCILLEGIDDIQHICNKQSVSSEKFKRNLITDGKKTVEQSVSLEKIERNLITDGKKTVEQSVSLGKIEKNLNTDKKETVEICMKKDNDYNQIVPSRIVKKKKEKRVQFTDFVKNTLNNSDDISPEEKEALLITYRKQIEAINLEDVSKNLSNNDTEHISNEKDIVEVDSPKNNASVAQSENQSEITIETHSEHKDLDTYVKERISLMDTDLEYIQCIKIPKNVYKKGMMYRIKDCYYDDDGEFLYRTPGLR